MSPPPRALILGLAGTGLGDAERRFFVEAAPLGFILFARNVDTPAQVKTLTAQLRALVGRGDAPILIDQEGGRVQRLRLPYWREAPPAEVFGRLAMHDLAAARRAVYLNHRLLADELIALGITVDCAPVVDLRHAGAHEVIGDRAFGGAPLLVADLGRSACQGLRDGGVQPIVKHIPGHGRGLVDSHLALPVCESGHAQLARTDFLPFRLLRDQPWAMTAHIVYEALDAAAPATASAVMVGQVIRRELGFAGLLVSDDLSMQALSGSLGERAKAALAAGCDLALHCNGRMEEMAEVASAVGPMSAAAEARLAYGQRGLGPQLPLARPERRAFGEELENLLQGA
ncbi:MAG: beta-N-acetylhexosaminidase [Rhodospirillales bacterium]|nr:beta-N-acetylhexosaminidase [Rhodospirillales bacterium]